MLMATPLAAQDTVRASAAMLRRLDKVSGRTTDLPLQIGEAVRYGRLEMRLGECRYPAGQEEVEASAYLIIRDIREDEAAFEGWMFASSPALSSLDHPRYDVWVLRCKT